MPRRSRQRSLLQRTFLSNWNNKATALVLAVTIWGIALATTLDDDHLEFNVELLCREVDEVVTSAVVTSKGVDELTPFPYSVVLTLKGRFQDLADVETTRVRIHVENGDIVSLSDKSHYDALPSGVEVVDAKPALIRVETERRVPVSVPVLVSGEGNLTDQRYTHDRTRDLVTPDKVALFMPESYRDYVEVRVSYPLRDVGPKRPVAVTLSESNIHFRKNVPRSHVSLDPDTPRELTILPGLVSVTTEQTRTVKVRFAVEPDKSYLVKSLGELAITCHGIPKQLDEWQKRVEEETFFLVCLVRGYQEATVDKAQRGEYIYYGLPEGVEVIDWDKTQFDLSVKDPTKQ